MAWAGRVMATGLPKTRTSPAVGVVMPYRIFMRVDLPAPVLAEQGVDLSLLDGEVGAVNRADEGILLDNPAHFNCVQTSSPPGRLSAAGAGVSRLLRGLVLVGGHPGVQLLGGLAGHQLARR